MRNLFSDKILRTNITTLGLRIYGASCHDTCSNKCIPRTLYSQMYAIYALKNTVESLTTELRRLSGYEELDTKPGYEALYLD